MKVYFSSTVKAKSRLEKNFQAIYTSIKELGHRHVSDFLINIDPKAFYTRSFKDAGEEYKAMVKKMKSAEVVVFEVTVPSLGIGYLVNLVLEMEKPVILLHTPEASPYLFRFIKSDKLQICEYTLANIKQVLSSAFKDAKESTNVRFTFFVTPKILDFLDFIAKKKHTPRAVFLRRLVEEAMKKEKFQPENPF